MRSSRTALVAGREEAAGGVRNLTFANELAAKRGADGKFTPLVAGLIGVISAAIGPVGSISAVGGCADRGSSDADRHATTNGRTAIVAAAIASPARARTTISATAIGAAVIDAAGANGAVGQGVIRNHRQTTDAGNRGCEKSNGPTRHDRSPLSGSCQPSQDSFVPH